MTQRRAWALPRVRGKLMRSSYSKGWAGASRSSGFGTPSTTFDLPASTAGSGGVTQEALRGLFAEDREDAWTGSPRMSKLRARGFLPPNVLPACGADKDSSERPSIDGDSRPGGETIDTPSTDSIDASSPAESSLDASRVTTRRCREDSGASASSTALSALRRPAALALAAASPVGAGACSATAARRTSIATRGAVVLWMPPAAATGYQNPSDASNTAVLQGFQSLSGAYRSKLLHCVQPMARFCNRAHQSS